MLVFVASIACPGPPPMKPTNVPPIETPPAAPASNAPAEPGFVATLVIEPADESVWIQRDGDKDKVAEKAEGWHREFAGKQVRVTGVPLQIPGAMGEPVTFRLDTLSLTGEADPAPMWVRVGPERLYTGTFAMAQGEVGSKSEGESWWVFSADGIAYELANSGDWKEGSATVNAREMERSPYVAARGGPVLWVLSTRQ